MRETTRASLTAPLVVFLGFTAYSLTVVAEHGFFAFLDVPLQGGWGLQISADLVIALWMFWIFAIPDARARGINVWPYLLLTPLFGSIAPLAYFVHRGLRGRGR